MNIDIVKVYEILRLNNMEHFISRIGRCEIKQESCFNCKIEQSAYNNSCIFCINSPNLTNNFKQKQNELDKLFIGASVMEQIGGTWRLTICQNIDKTTFGPVYRLPTVEESPKNVWLAPWLEEPEELQGKEIIIYYADNLIAHYHGFSEVTECDWEEVIAIMIMGDFK